MNRHETIEAAIRRALGDMGVQQEPKEDEEQQPQHVPVEAALSQAIGGPGAYGLNDDHSLARALGAHTLTGERL